MDQDLLFEALTDASRRRLHAHEGRMLNELCNELAVTRQAVTEHLRVLEEGTLIATE